MDIYVLTANLFSWDNRGEGILAKMTTWVCMYVLCCVDI